MQFRRIDRWNYFIYFVSDFCKSWFKCRADRRIRLKFFDYFYFFRIYKYFTYETNTGKIVSKMCRNNEYFEYTEKELEEIFNSPGYFKNKNRTELIDKMLR